MEGLTLQERHIQLLSFLKDPQAHPHSSITLEDFNLHLGENPKAEAVREFRQIAIDFMESGVIRQGYLRGNRRTPDIPINRLEDFVLNIAVNVQLAKWVIAKSPGAYKIFHDLRLFDPSVTPNEIIEDYNDMHQAFDRLSYKLLRWRLIRIDRLRTIARILIHMLPENLNKHWEKAMIFDLVDELIFIFIRDIPGAGDNIIASHIHDFISGRKDSSLRGVYLPGQDAIRKRVEKLRKQLITTPPV